MTGMILWFILAGLALIALWALIIYFVVKYALYLVQGRRWAYTAGRTRLAVQILVVVLVVFVLSAVGGIVMSPWFSADANVDVVEDVQRALLRPTFTPTTSVMASTAIVPATVTPSPLAATLAAPTAVLTSTGSFGGSSTPSTGTGGPVVATKTVLTFAEAAAASSGAAPDADLCTPTYAVRLVQGQTLIPNWGYGPWSVTGVAVPKIRPNGAIPRGVSQPVTHFDGRNWEPQGSWSYTLPVGVTEVWVATQGDAPSQVVWSGNTLTFSTNAAISAAAPNAMDNAPHPIGNGSIGISLALCVK